MSFASIGAGIFAAHPWLSGPSDTYLGFWRRGGGAAAEHSHAFNLWQHFAHRLGQGRVSRVTANLDYIEENGVNYDRLCLANLETEHGLDGPRGAGRGDAAGAQMGAAARQEWRASSGFAAIEPGKDAVKYPGLMARSWRPSPRRVRTTLFLSFGTLRPR